jgi:hypothetical protein
MATSTERVRALRARRAASLEAGPYADRPDPLAPSVEVSIAALELGDRDLAAAALARRYAEVMDNAKDPVWATRWIGPLLLRSLEELGATPKSRPAAKKTPGPARDNQVAKLRAAHMASKKRPGL